MCCRDSFCVESSTSKKASFRARSSSSRFAQGIGYVKAEFPGLPRAKKFAGSANQQVRLGDFKTICGADHGFEPRAAIVRHASRRHQDAVRFLRAAADAPAKLVQLCQAEALGMLDHHHGGVGYVHADFDHRRGHQNLHFISPEALHHIIFFFARHPPMQKAHF